ncbi:MAG: ABC transporter permease [Terracidiphilus sp.]
MGVLRRIGNLFQRTRVDREIGDELRAHIDLRIEENRSRGMSADEARRDALLRFGNLVSTRERVTAADATLGLADCWRDLRYAVRKLRNAPGFALTAILTLALGIGANVVVFGVLNAILLRPLNLPGADRLVQVTQNEPDNLTHSYPDYVDLRARNSTFEDLATYRMGEAGVSSGGAAQMSWGYEVSANYFDLLGVQPALGRLLHASDEHGPNSAPYIVLSDGYWRSRFNADPRVVGMTINLNKHPFTILGVAPASFNGTEIFYWPDFWMPMVNEEQVEGYSFLTKRINHGIYVVGMLRPGVTPRQALDNLNAIAHQLTREHPVDDDGLGILLAKPGLMGDFLGGPARSFLGAIMILALLVLAAACVNLAGIFAARSADRARELAIRLSIGSTRWRLLRQVLTEAVVISIGGGIAGSLIAAGLLRFLSVWQPVAEFPLHVTVTPDTRVYLIALVLTLASGILPGLLPARQIWKTDASQTMKSGATATGLLRRLTLRDLLLGLQIMLCALLVTASLVSLRGMERSLHAPMGFNAEGVLLALEDLHMAGYSDDSSLPVQRRMIEEASRIPGVTAVGTINSAPLSGSSSNTDVYREGTANPRSSNSVLSAQYFSISPEYLHAAQTRLLAGRGFTWDDGPKSPKVAIINAIFAHKMFGGVPAVGQHFMGGDRTLYQIVGVVEDGKYNSLTEDPRSAMFFPLAQNTDGDTTLVVRSQAPASEVAAKLNRVLTGIDSSMPIVLRTWQDQLALVLFPARVATAALGVMGLLAAMLAITGVFGMSAYTVSKRLRELGIRVALGAHRGQVMRAALGRPLLVLLAGSAAGLVLGVLASQLLAHLVYQATSRDPLVLLGAIAAMLLIGLVATWIPARRALAVNPAQLLREE